MQILVDNVISRYQFSKNKTKSAKSLCNLALNAIMIDFVLKLVMFPIFLFFQKTKAACKRWKIFSVLFQKVSWFSGIWDFLFLLSEIELLKDL